MKTSESVKLISAALIKAQKEIKHAVKDATNSHLKNSYATLESVIDAAKGPLLDQEITLLQSLDNKMVTTRLQHSSGEFIESQVELLLTKQDMQGLGSAITYARRYSIAALLNMAQADDDGTTASKGPKPKEAKVVSKQPVVPKGNLPF